MKPSSLRLALPGEEERVSELLQACGQDLLQRFGLRNWSVPYPLFAIREEIERGEVWVLEQGNQLILTLTLDFTLPEQYEAEWFSASEESAAYLHRLAVSPQAQGQGLGSWGLKEAERLTRERGLEWLRFDAYTRNAALQRFYQQRGYKFLREFQVTYPSIGTDTFTLYEKKV